MKILLFSDLHNFDEEKLNEIKIDPDLIVFLGDIKGRTLDQIIINFPNKTYFGVLGNHDEHGLFTNINTFIKLRGGSEKIQDANKNLLEFNGITFTGLEGCVNYVRKECESSENKTITSYDYNLLKPINKDVIQKINDYFDFHLSNRQVEKLNIYEYSDKKSKNYEIYFKDKNLYVDTDKSSLKITITHNNLFKTIYNSKKENLVGTEINKTEYDPELFKKDIWTKIRDVIGDDINAKPYEDMIKNANVIANEKEIEESNKEER